MALTRRQFLRRGGIAAAGGFFGPSLFGNPFFQRALAQTIGDRYFISLFLNGGNDGLGTIIPYDNGGGSLRTHYELARGVGGGGLRIDAGPGGGNTEGLDQAMPSTPFLDPNTGAQLGFHPGLQNFRDMYDDGHLVVLQGCGYPQPNLSHDVATNIWETGDPLHILPSNKGWVGRHLEGEYTPNQIPGVTIGNRVAGELEQSGTSVLAISRLSRFGFPFDSEYSSDNAAKRTAFEALYADAANSGIPTSEFIGNSGLSTADAAASYPQLHGAYRTERPVFNALYDDQSIGGGTSMTRDLREVAKIIYGVAKGVPNINSRFFQVSNGGYDTHSDQGGGQTSGRHYSLHREVASAVKIFFDDLADMAQGQVDGRQNLPEKVCILVWSEFSRRVIQNDNGTDHGTQGPMFLIGHAVNGGVVGNHPNISPVIVDANQGNTVYSQGAGDPYRSTDFRDVYGTVLKHWLNVPPATVQAMLPLDSPADAAKYWKVANFDLPLF